MNIRKKNTTIEDIFINVFFPILVVTYILSSTVLTRDNNGDTNIISFILKLFRYGIYFACAIKVMLDKWRRTDFLMAFFLIVMIAICFLSNRNTEAICFFIVAFALRNVDYEILLNKFLVFGGGTLFLVVFASQIGIIEDFVRIESSRSNRHFLGFDWAATAPILALFFILCYMALKHGKLRFWELIIIETIAIWLFWKTNSRFPFVLSVVAPLFIWVYQNRRIKNVLSFVEKGLFIIPWLLWGICYYLNYKYDAVNSKWYKLNLLLSQRLSLGHEALNTYPIHLFWGQKIEWKGYGFVSMQDHNVENYNFIDCAYMRFLFEYGILFMIVLLLLYSLGIFLAVKHNKGYLAWILTFIAIFGTIEFRLFAPSGNPFNWALVYFLSNARRENNNESLLEKI